MGLRETGWRVEFGSDMSRWNFSEYENVKATIIVFLEDYEHHSASFSEFESLNLLGIPKFTSFSVSRRH